MAELMIGMGAFTVPNLFSAGQKLLLAAGQSDSTTYLLLSAVALAFPSCRGVCSWARPFP
jgi:hypothetical protein